MLREVLVSLLSGCMYVLSQASGKSELTPPFPSFTTSTKPPLLPLYSSHFLYSVARLTPSCSRPNTSSQSSTSCSLAGTSSLISSASARVSSFPLSPVLARHPRSVSGVSGGGWKGDAVRGAGT